MRTFGLLSLVVSAIKAKDRKLLMYDSDVFQEAERQASEFGVTCSSTSVSCLVFVYIILAE